MMPPLVYFPCLRTGEPWLVCSCVDCTLGRIEIATDEQSKVDRRRELGRVFVDFAQMFAIAIAVSAFWIGIGFVTGVW